MYIAEFLVNRHDKCLLHVCDQGALKKVFLEYFRLDRAVLLLIEEEPDYALPLDRWKYVIFIFVIFFF